VDSQGAVTSFPVTSGRQYQVTAIGTYFAGGNSAEDIEADAKYSQDDVQAGTPPFPWTDSVNNYGSYGPELLDLQMSQGGPYTTPVWGSYNGAHTYTAPLVTATGSTLDFKIYDI